MKDTKQNLLEIREFIKDFSDTLNDTTKNEAIKQTMFLDNQSKVKETMTTLTSIIDIYTPEENEDITVDDEKIFELATTLKNMLVKTLTDYKNGFKKVNPNITKEETTVIVNEETLSEAVKNDSSTKQLIEDMNQIQTEVPANTARDITHMILIGKKQKMYINASKPEELIAYINQVADAKPGVSIDVYEISFKPIPLKTTQKTVYTL